MVNPLPVKGSAVHKEYNGKNTVYTFLVVLTAALTGLLLGYDNGNSLNFFHRIVAILLSLHKGLKYLRLLCG